MGENVSAAASPSPEAWLDAVATTLPWASRTENENSPAAAARPVSVLVALIAAPPSPPSVPVAS